jgi:HK97 family phage prohead protease
MSEPNKENPDGQDLIEPMPSAQKISSEIKYYEECKSEETDEDRTVLAVISSDRVDRDGEILLPEGANTKEYAKNPVILWNHDAYQPPIGKALWVKRKGNQLTAKIKFAATEMAETVWQLFKGGFLNAFSIRFRPMDGRAPTPEDIKANPSWKSARFVFTKWELLEASPVTIPANPDALAMAVKSKQFKDNDRVARMFQIDMDEEEILFEIKPDEVPDIKSIKEPEIQVEIPVDEYAQEVTCIESPVKQFANAYEGLTGKALKRP